MKRGDRVTVQDTVTGLAGRAGVVERHAPDTKYFDTLVRLDDSVRAWFNADELETQSP